MSGPFFLSRQISTVWKVISTDPRQVGAPDKAYVNLAQQEESKMANRYFQQFIFSSEKMPVQLYLQVGFGAAGAPTIQQGSSFVSSVVRNSAGDYTVNLTDAYNRLLGVQHVFIKSTAPSSPAMFVKTNNVTSKILGVVFNSAGTATDPANGEVVLMVISLKNSSV